METIRRSLEASVSLVKDTGSDVVRRMNGFTALTPTPVGPPTEAALNLTGSPNRTIEGGVAYVQGTVHQWRREWLAYAGQVTLADLELHMIAVLSVLGFVMGMLLAVWLLRPRGFLVRTARWLWHRFFTRWRRTVRAKPQPPKRVPVSIEFNKGGPIVKMHLPNGTYEGVVTMESAALLLAESRSCKDVPDKYADAGEIQEMLLSGVVQYEKGLYTSTPGVVSFRRDVNGRVFGVGSRASFGGAGTRLVTAHHVWRNIIDAPSVWVEHKGAMYELKDTHKLRLSAYSPEYEPEKMRSGRLTGIDVAIVNLPDVVWSVLGVKSLTPEFGGVANRTGTVHGFAASGKFATSVAKLRPTDMIDRYEHTGGTEFGWSGSPVIEARTGKLIAVHTGRKATRDGNYASGLRPFAPLRPEESEILSYDQWKRERELEARDAERFFEVQFNLDDGRDFGDDRGAGAAVLEDRFESQVTYTSGKAYNTIDRSAWSYTPKNGGIVWADEEEDKETSELDSRRAAFMVAQVLAEEHTESGLSPRPEVAGGPEQDFRASGGGSPTPRKVGLEVTIQTDPAVQLIDEPSVLTTAQSPSRGPRVSDEQILEKLTGMERRLQKLETERNQERRDYRQKVPPNGGTTETSLRDTTDTANIGGVKLPSSSIPEDSVLSEPAGQESASIAAGGKKKRQRRKKVKDMPNNSENSTGPNEVQTTNGAVSSTTQETFVSARSPKEAKPSTSSSVSNEAIQAAVSLLASVKGHPLSQKAQELSKGKGKLPGSAT